MGNPKSRLSFIGFSIVNRLCFLINTVVLCSKSSNFFLRSDFWLLSFAKIQAWERDKFIFRVYSTKPKSQTNFFWILHSEYVVITTSTADLHQFREAAHMAAAKSYLPLQNHSEMTLECINIIFKRIVNFFCGVPATIFSKIKIFHDALDLLQIPPPYPLLRPRKEKSR